MRKLEKCVLTCDGCFDFCGKFCMFVSSVMIKLMDDNQNKRGKIT